MTTIQLSRFDLRPLFQDLPGERITFRDFKKEVQEAIRLIGSGTLDDRSVSGRVITIRPPKQESQTDDRPGLKVVKTPVKFNAGKGFVNAVFHIGKHSFGVRFESPEQILEFFNALLECASSVWPNNEFIQMFTEDDD